MEDSEGGDGYWGKDAEGIEVDCDWPSRLCTLLSEQLPLTNGTIMRIQVERDDYPMLFGSSHSIAPCAHRHVHLLCAYSASLVMTNVMVCFAYALASTIAEQDWSKPIPSWDDIDPWIKRVAHVIENKGGNVGLADVLREGDIYEALRGFHASMIASVNPASANSQLWNVFAHARDKKVQH